MRREVIGNATLYLGDCREVLPMLGKVDAVVTDPPYGIGVAKSGHVGGAGRNAKWPNARHVEYGPQEWDAQPVAAETMAAVRLAGRYAIVFGGNYYDAPASSGWLVWDKENDGTKFADCELAWTNLPISTRRIRYLWNGFARANNEPRGDHPTQKPVEVMRWAINWLPEDAQIILDPFMGSGTTGVACARLGRRFIGVEIEERYFEIACRRIEEAQRQGDLFIKAAS